MADTGLFGRLKRLFSTDVIIRNDGSNQLKVIDINKVQQSGEYETNSLVDRFNRIYTNSNTSIYGVRFILDIVFCIKFSTSAGAILPTFI